MLFKFDKCPSLFNITDIQTNSDRSSWFIPYSDTLITLLKTNSKLSVRIITNYDKNDYIFSLSGSTKSIDYVLKDYLSELKISIYEESDNIIEDVKVEEVVEAPMEIFQIQEKPEFPGGDVALNTYLAKNTVYPPMAQEIDLQGTVYIKFVVLKSGKIGDVIILKSVDKLLDDEAVRVVRSLPDWTPGKFNGNAVSVWFIVPIKFKLNN